MSLSQKLLCRPRSPSLHRPTCIRYFPRCHLSSTRIPSALLASLLSARPPNPIVTLRFERVFTADWRGKSTVSLFWITHMSLSSERLLIPQLLALAMQIEIVVFHYTIYIKGVTPVAGRDFDPPTPPATRTIFLPE